jgi:cysteine desulfurase / selenocysteine lyase
LRTIQGVTVYGPDRPEDRTATVSIRLDGHAGSEVGWRLDQEYDILCRVGLHCSPAAHRTLGTLPEGTVRLSAGLNTTLAEIDAVIAALGEIAAGR